MNDDIQSSVNLLESLLDPVEELISSAMDEKQRSEIISSEHFRPAQDEAIGRWFAVLLSIREELLQIINHSSLNACGELKSIKTQNPKPM